MLLLHESGHYVVMRKFGYRDLQMFFIPFVGAAVSGWAGKARGYERTLVALAGPVPGILFGLVLAFIFILRGHPLVGQAAALFLWLNGFNLLPLLPLDGGRVLQETFFCRSRWMEAGFQITAGLVLVVIAILARDQLFGVFGAALLAAAPASLRTSRIAAQLRDAGEAPDIASPSDATLTFLVRIATEIEHASPRPLKPSTLAVLVRTVVEKMNRRAPSAGATVLLLGTYGAAFVLALVGVGVIAVGYGVRGDTVQPMRAGLSATGSATRRASRNSDLYSAGQQAYSQKDYATAIRLWNTVVADDPRHPHAWNAIGMAYNQTGQWAEAITAISEQLKVTPSHDQAWVNLGWALQHVGKPQEAISAYRKHIEINPLDSWAHKGLGLLLLDAHQWKDASTELRQAASITPNDADIDVALGRACVKLGDVAAGVEAFERAKKNATSPRSESLSIRRMHGRRKRRREPPHSL
ncbi:MAG: hypothetical protein DMF84_31865 [Acidobacteria bacterium]|nr:MAG: hypothetical protein DMF84_31865 [Acidobacteriota bacterium]